MASVSSAGGAKSVRHVAAGELRDPRRTSGEDASPNRSLFRELEASSFSRNRHGAGAGRRHVRGVGFDDVGQLLGDMGFAPPSTWLENSARASAHPT